MKSKTQTTTTDEASHDTVVLISRIDGRPKKPVGQIKVTERGGGESFMYKNFLFQPCYRFNQDEYLD